MISARCGDCSFGSTLPDGAGRCRLKGTTDDGGDRSCSFYRKRYAACTDAVLLAEEHPEKVIFIDTETTGIDHLDDELLEVGIVDASGRTVHCGMVRPERHREWPDAQAVNGISPADVRDAPSAEEASAMLQRIVGAADAVVGYNIGFDLRFLKGIGVEPRPDAMVVDVMTDYAAIAGEWVRGWGCWRWQSLDRCMSHYGIVASTGRHRASTDAELTRRCFFAVACDQADHPEHIGRRYP